MATNQPYIEMNVSNPLTKVNFRERFLIPISDDQNLTWFPRRCCQGHLALDGRYLGTYKCEWEGIKMVSLCSKSYIIEDGQGNQKISCKVISKKNLKDPM